MPPFQPSKDNSSSNNNVTASPFFAPSTPRVSRSMSSPGGSFVGRSSKKVLDKETKASVLGTTGNLVNAIIGAGIVGIPFAIEKSGLLAGVFMVVLCAFLTDKSLKMLIFTAKHIGVPSYEVLCEAAFGKPGFYFISLSMFIMAYGAMVSYLMIVKDTLPLILGVDNDNEPVKRGVLVVSSFLVIFPISCQRDMADLAKTSSLSVLFDCIMVAIIACSAPMKTNVPDMDSFLHILRTSTIHPSTFFLGLGVLSFAFVCQHSAFIIAGSLQNPTRRRWGRVTTSAMTLCVLLATICGVTGFLGFGDATQGNILNNFPSSSTTSTSSSVSLWENSSNAARALLCTTMFFVYPMESFVARHVFVVLLFQGRSAHEGDDHAVLARSDRRIGLTLFLYLAALIPALLFQDLGSVLAITGALGGSCLSYIGPGAVYLAIHGEQFLGMVEDRWPGRYGGHKNNTNNGTASRKEDVESPGHHGGAADTNNSNNNSRTNTLTWYASLMPIWCEVASVGKDALKSFQEKEALKSPHPSRIGKYIHRSTHTNTTTTIGNKPGIQLKHHHNNNKRMVTFHPKNSNNDEEQNYDEDDGMVDETRPLMVRAGSFTGSSSSTTTTNTSFVIPPHIIQSKRQPRLVTPPYGSTANNGNGSNSTTTSTNSSKKKMFMISNQGIAAAIMAKNNGHTHTSSDNDDEDCDAEEDLEAEPTWSVFLESIGFVVFGVIALNAGLISVFWRH